MRMPPKFSNGSEPPEPSCVSVKSDDSMRMPPKFSNGAEPPEPSCVSVKSDDSMRMPPKFSNGAEPPEPSCVSVKSDDSMRMPPKFSNGAEPPEPSYVSVKSDDSMRMPPKFSNGAEPSCVSVKSDDSMRMPPKFSDGAEPPEPSCASMKSDDSMRMPPKFSDGAEPPEPSCVSWKSDDSMRMPPKFSDVGTLKRGKSNLLQDQSRCGLCEQLLTDPVSITCGHSFCRLCINRYWDETDQTGDFICPSCRKRSKTRPALHSHTEESIKHQKLEDDVLHRVLQKHKTCMKNRYESLFEGIKTQENRTLLNRIYTQLYIIEGESEGVNEEHEIIKMEKTSNKYLQETPINCLDIFRPVENPEEEMEGVNSTAVTVNGIRQNERKEDKGLKEVRAVLTKGIAGIGKTVSVQKFILDWAEGTANQDVDFMFVLPFRELNLIKDEQYSLYTLLCTFHPELKDLDYRTCDGRKVVFIFDGLDESRIPLNFSQCEKVSDITVTSSVGVLITNLLKGELLPSAHIWITSRPAAANQIPPHYINRVTEIQGFNDPQKEEYFRKKISDQDQAQKIISHIKTARSLHIMCHIPVFCWISATVLQRIMKQSKTEIPKTLTEMYSHFLITQTNMKKEKYEENFDWDPVELLESNRAMLLKLAELAFNQLMKGNVMFYEEDLRECGIDLTEASVYSGICTEIFREECVLYQRKVYSFVHLSFQEFLAAFYVFHCYLSKNMKTVSVLLNVPPHELLIGAVSEASESPNGHLDLFLRFLLGISLDSSQKILQGLLIHTESTSQSINKTVTYIKYLISTEDLNTDRSINLFLCLTEMNDQDLPREIQKYINSDESSKKDLSALECLALSYMLQTSEEVLEELDLKKYSTSRIAYMKLLPAVNNCRKAILAGCDLTMEHCETICCALKSKSSTLKELDLSNNDLQDSGVELLSAGLKSSHCKLETLRLVSCNLDQKTCANLASVLNLESSCLKNLDLSYNDLQDSGVDLLCAGLKSSRCNLETLRLARCNLKNLESVLNLGSSTLKQMDLSYNDLQDSGIELLSAGLKSSHCKLQILRLAMCNLGVKACGNLAAVVNLESSCLKELDLSNNDLQDSGVELLSAGLKSSHCKLQILRLSGCMVSEKGCSSLAAALSSHPSHLKELDLTFNHPGESGQQLFSARAEDPGFTVRMEYGGEIRMKPGMKKYGCDFTLDPNTAMRFLSMSEDNRTVKRGWREEQPYPDHPERFNQYPQVLSRESVTGRCYWEAEWNEGGEVDVAMSYKTISRKGNGYECRFGLNRNSWRLFYSQDCYFVDHDKNSTDLPRSPSGCRRVGVYVDCPAGTLSFYSVSQSPTHSHTKTPSPTDTHSQTPSHTLTHLHTFYTTFTQPLYAGIGVGPHSSVTLCKIE
ncbi:NACHT, LRR and PYD domains-containing protein 12-like isoform X18 [Astyanax mexicanus]|uniref:NACHT, LRR and PYD domains-containing protein 12-like isoform X18 n=1 Tax=Astyanax mexicanus TaxID=7994 RepID=UPI0020CB4D68|nr:NACHT, LRR and PYD domains-containing protein 12-like isoform X18 [Astyanax mexicanus]